MQAHEVAFDKSFYEALEELVNGKANLLKAINFKKAFT